MRHGDSRSHRDPRQEQSNQPAEAKGPRLMSQAPHDQQVTGRLLAY